MPPLLMRRVKEGKEYLFNDRSSALRFAKEKDKLDKTEVREMDNGFWVVLIKW